jgi:hypothetical protein
VTSRLNLWSIVDLLVCEPSIQTSIYIFKDGCPACLPQPPALCHPETSISACCCCLCGRSFVRGASPRRLPVQQKTRRNKRQSSRFRRITRINIRALATRRQYIRCHRHLRLHLLPEFCMYWNRAGGTLRISRTWRFANRRASG